MIRGLWATDTAGHNTAYGMRYEGGQDGPFWDETIRPDPELDPDCDDEHPEDQR